jgi:hypothetical protein
MLCCFLCHSHSRYSILALSPSCAHTLNTCDLSDLIDKTYPKFSGDVLPEEQTSAYDFLLSDGDHRIKAALHPEFHHLVQIGYPVSGAILNVGHQRVVHTAEMRSE